MWSIGVIAFALLTFSLPFGPDRRGDFEWCADDPRLSDPCRDFVSRLLSTSPLQRLSASQALSHPWLREAHPDANAQRFDPALMSMGVATSLIGFRERSVLQRTAASIAVEHLSGEKLHELTQLFQSLDRDGDGTVTKDDLIEALRAMLSQAKFDAISNNKHPGDDSDIEELQDFMDDNAKVVAMVGLMDPDNDGKIAYSDFLAAAAESCFDSCVDLCWEAFRKFDLTDSGSISRQELETLLDAPVMDDVIDAAEKAGLKTPTSKGDLARAFSALGGTPQTVDQIFEATDKANDGRITFEEFMMIVQGGDC